MEGYTIATDGGTILRLGGKPVALKGSYSKWVSKWIHNLFEARVEKLYETGVGPISLTCLTWGSRESPLVIPPNIENPSARPLPWAHAQPTTHFLD